MATGALLFLPSPAITSSHAMYNVTPERKRGSYLNSHSLVYNVPLQRDSKCPSLLGCQLMWAPPPFALRTEGWGPVHTQWRGSVLQVIYTTPISTLPPHRRNLYLSIFWLGFELSSPIFSLASFSCQSTFNPVSRLAQEVRNRRRKRVVDLIWKIWV